jgi:hypothetical protein
MTRHADHDVGGIIGTVRTRPVTDDLPLFNAPPVARTSDPDTSHEAEDALASRGHQVWQVVHAAYLYRDMAGVTQDEAADRTGLTTHEAGRRLSDAVAMGYLEDTGLRRPGQSGRAQMVRRITEQGVRWMADQST